MSVDFISVSCISRRQLFILVRNKSVVLLLWMISFMVTLRLWISYSYFNIDDSSLIIYKICNAKNYPNLMMTLYDCWISYIMMYHVSTCSEFHYFVNFISQEGSSCLYIQEKYRVNLSTRMVVEWKKWMCYILYASVIGSFI